MTTNQPAGMPETPRVTFSCGMHAVEQSRGKAHCPYCELAEANAAHQKYACAGESLEQTLIRLMSAANRHEAEAQREKERADDTHRRYMEKFHEIVTLQGKLITSNEALKAQITETLKAAERAEQAEARCRELEAALKHCVDVFHSMANRGAYPKELLPDEHRSDKEKLFMGKQGLVFATRLLSENAAIDAAITAAQQKPQDYEQVLADHRRLVRELDVLLNGEEGAARQASLCDIVSQIRQQKPQDDGWVKCSERLPTDSTSVLVVYRGAVYKTCYYGNHWLLPSNKPVTHWRPLPPLPKE